MKETEASIDIPALVGADPSEVNPAGVGLTWERSRHPQVKTCGYSRLAPFGAARSSRILSLRGVGTVRLFSSGARQPFKLSVEAPKYPATGKFLGKLHLSL